MRAVALAAVLLAAPAAGAGPWRPSVVIQPPHHGPRPHAATSVSHLIYLNDCRPNGCTVSPGYDDSRTDHSQIPTSTAHLDAWGWGDAKWQALVQCVKDTYAPFDIQITTTDPGTTSHFEVMIGGTSQQLDPQLQAGGVAPFIPCQGEMVDNVISFVFAGSTQNTNFLCGAVAQESSHVFGLDHELDPLDPMTYLDLGSHKIFQYDNADCGEYQPRTCWCDGTTQNSVQYLVDTFGASNLPAPSLQIESPSDGQWVKPGFQVTASATSPLTIPSASLSIDGSVTATDAPAEPATSWTFASPALEAGGDHQLTVAATDNGARTADHTITVHVTASCSGGESCAHGTHCLGGFCLPGADVGGGLGAPCTGNSDCITGSCAQEGDQSFCTGTCDAGGVCPSGFACDKGANACIPTGGSGGCDSGGAPSAVLGLGIAAAIAIRRRPKR